MGDAHAPTHTIVFEAFVVLLGMLANMHYRASRSLPLSDKLKRLLSEHIGPSLHKHPPPLALELRAPPLTKLLAAHRPVLRRCYDYWNSEHGGLLQRGGGESSKTLSLSNAEMEARPLEDSASATPLFSLEARCNFNQILIMLQSLEMLSHHLTTLHVAELFEEVTRNRPSMPAGIHPENAKDELIFDEFIELLLRIAFKLNAGTLKLGVCRDVSQPLLELVDGFLLDFYASTDRFYPGNLGRLTKRELAAEPPPGAPSGSKPPHTLF